MSGLKKVWWLSCIVFCIAKTNGLWASPEANTQVLHETCEGTLGDNLIIGGDFGTGSASVLASNTDIAQNLQTECDYVPALAPGDGNVCIANTTANASTNPSNYWITTGDNSSDPNGYMLVVDSWYSEKIVYQTTVSGLCENSVYQFSIDVINLVEAQHTWAADAFVDFFINNEQIFTTESVENDETWHTYTFYYTVPEGMQEVTFHIENAVPGGRFGDFALDNISMRQCYPLTELAIEGPESICEGEAIGLAANLLVHGYVTPYFQWQRYNPSNDSWTDLAGATTPFLNFEVATPNLSGLYKCVVASSPNNLANNTCWGAEDTFVLNIQQTPKNTEISRIICEDEYYLFAGLQLNSSGYFQDTLSNEFGCDSVVMLNLTVAPFPNKTIDVQICAGDSYFFNGSSYTESGSYDYVSMSQYGCDSTTTLELSVLPSFDQTIEAQICKGDSYVFGENTYQETGFYTQNLSTEQGCDSTVHLELQVVDKVETNLVEYICEGASFVMNGTPYTTSGNYEATLTANSGCDSLVRLDLEVLPTYEIQLEAAICAGEHFNLESNTYTETGFYTHQLLTTEGCDSTVHLNLVVHPNPTTILEEHICFGESYDIAGITYTESGNYTHVFSSATGCDSTVILQLLVQDPIENSFTTTLCQGETMLLGDQVLGENGNYTHVFQTAAGCDSTVTVQLEVLSHSQTHLERTICNGESVVMGGNQYATSGFYEVTMQAANGCDSLVTLQLEVLPTIKTNRAEIVCQGESVQIGEASFSSAGFHSATLQASNGCDSIVHLTLSVIPESVEQLEHSVCHGDLFNGIEIENDTTFIQSLQTAFGCDSTVHTHVEVLPLSEASLEVDLCVGEAYNGINIESDTVLIDYYTNYWGCDSTVYTNITIHPNYVVNDTIIVDSNEDGRVIAPKYDVLLPSNRLRNDTTVLSDTLITVNGCDSILNTVYIYLYPAETHISVTLCEGNDYLGTPYFQSTILVEQLETTSGTDSIVYTHVEVFPTYRDTIFAEICHGESYVAEGTSQTVSGTYTDLYHTAEGCDSVIVTQLHVWDDHSTAEQMEICEGSSAMVHGQAETTNGVYTQLFTDQNGCDSTSTVTLIVHPIHEQSTEHAICFGESYDGQMLQTDTSFTENFTSVYGCDSIVHRHIQVLYPSDTTLYVDLPVGGTYQGEVYTENTHLEATTTASNGCDSTIYTIITVIDAVETFLEYEICEGEQINDTAYFQDTTFTAYLSTEAGFDSLVTTQITVHHPQTISIEAVSCVFPDGTTQSITYSDQNGCDSTVVTTYINQNTTPQEIDITLCEGESYAGIVFTESQTFVQENTNQYGCDSLTTLHVTVLPTPQIDVSGIEQFCATETIILDLGSLEATIWTEQNDTLSNNIISQGGYYYIQATNANGCTAMDTIWVPAPTQVEAEYTYNPAPCYNPSGASITIDTVYGGEAPYVYSLNGGAFQQNPVFGGLSSGVFEINIEDANGCSFNDVLVIENPMVLPEVILGDDQLIQWGDSIQLDAQITNPQMVEQVFWSPAEGLSCDDCPNPVATPNETTVYTVTVVTHDGCEDSDDLILRVEKERNVYIPNAFTPNGDGANDVFLVYPGQGVAQVQLMQIYDRWGNHLFERTDFDPHDSTLGWDGQYRGQYMNSGVYVYYIEILFEDGVVKQYKGDVTLL